MRPQTPQRAARLAHALAEIERFFGTGIIRRLQDPPARDPAARAVPSGSVGLDLATGLGGLPRGHLTEYLGPESSGKTTLLYAALAATQHAGGLVALVDTEGSADGATLAACGVDLDGLLLARPTSARDALLLLTILARCGGLDALGLGSIAALRDLPSGSRHLGPIEREALDTARLLTRGLRVLTAALKDGPTAVLATNLALPLPYDEATWSTLPPHRSTGGLALRHFAALRILVTPLAELPLLTPGSGAGAVGLRVGLTVVKHKLGVAGGTARVDLLVDRGLDRAEELVRLGLAAGILVAGPLGVAHDGTQLGRSPAAVRRRLADDGALADALTNALMAVPSAPRVA